MDQLNSYRKLDVHVFQFSKLTKLHLIWNVQLNSRILWLNVMHLQDHGISYDLDWNSYRKPDTWLKPTTKCYTFNDRLLSEGAIENKVAIQLGSYTC